MIKVLLQSRTNLFSKPGGDATQIISLKNKLNQKGLNAEISTALKPNLDAYDEKGRENLSYAQRYIMTGCLQIDKK